MAQINKASEYFNTVLYTGTGSELAITGVGFQPDWTWIKRRDAVANGGMFDNVRGATKLLSSSQTDGEQTLAQSLKSFDSDGFTLGTGTNGYVNTNGSTTVAWNWLGANTTASNTDGDIASTVSANTTSGFSIVSYTGNATAGATIGHGLGSTPKMIIVKNRESVYDWRVYHQSLGSTKYLNLNTDGGFGTATSIWNDTNPTSSVFSIGDSPRVNESGIGFIAYCFAEKKGFSKFGSYTGNGNVDSPFIYLGFKPAFMIFKRTDSAVDWTMYDNKRIGYNPNNYKLRPNLSNAEYSTAGYFEADIVSNGFKIRTSDAEVNTSGGTYIYMAFAENPFTTSTGIPTTAR
jgi:hypothetical protein